MSYDRKQRALEWLYTELKVTQMRYGITERKRGRKREELEALQIRKENIEFCIDYVNAAEDDDYGQKNTIQE